MAEKNTSGNAPLVTNGTSRMTTDPSTIGSRGWYIVVKTFSLPCAVINVETRAYKMSGMNFIGLTSSLTVFIRSHIACHITDGLLLNQSAKTLISQGYFLESCVASRKRRCLTRSRISSFYLLGFSGSFPSDIRLRRWIAGRGWWGGGGCDSCRAGARRSRGTPDPSGRPQIAENRQ
jgi:hypothetical protein